MIFIPLHFQVAVLHDQAILPLMQSNVPPKIREQCLSRTEGFGETDWHSHHCHDFHAEVEAGYSPHDSSGAHPGEAGGSRVVWVMVFDYDGGSMLEAAHHWNTRVDGSQDDNLTSMNLRLALTRARYGAAEMVVDHSQTVVAPCAEARASVEEVVGAQCSSSEVASDDLEEQEAESYSVAERAVRRLYLCEDEPASVQGWVGATLRKGPSAADMHGAEAVHEEP